MKKIAGVLLLLMLASCSNQQVYDGVMRNRLNDCLMQDVQVRDACASQYQKSYRQYHSEIEAMSRQEDRK